MPENLMDIIDSLDDVDVIKSIELDWQAIIHRCWMNQTSYIVPPGEIYAPVCQEHKDTRVDVDVNSMIVTDGDENKPCIVEFSDGDFDEDKLVKLCSAKLNYITYEQMIYDCKWEPLRVTQKRIGPDSLADILSIAQLAAPSVTDWGILLLGEDIPDRLANIHDRRVSVARCRPTTVLPQHQQEAWVFAKNWGKTSSDMVGHIFRLDSAKLLGTNSVELKWISWFEWKYVWRVVF